MRAEIAGSLRDWLDGLPHAEAGVLIPASGLGSPTSLTDGRTAARTALPAESVAMALSLEDPLLVQCFLLMLAEDEPPVPPSLLAPLTAHGTLEVRLTAVALLSRWGDSASREVLMRFLRDPSLAVRERVVRAFEVSGVGWTPTVATAALQMESDAGLARRIAELVVRNEPVMGARALQRVAAVLVAQRRSGDVIEEVLAVLRRLDEWTWQRLVSHVHGRFQYSAGRATAEVGSSVSGVTDCT